MKKIFGYAKRHKIWSLVILAVLIYGGYYVHGKVFSSSVATLQYVTADVQKGTVIASISGAGQVSSVDQVDVKPKASGDINYVGVSNGQNVSTGYVVAKIDSTDAEKAVRDAETNLETAKLSFEKFMQPADSLTILQSQNSLAQAKESLKSDKDSLQKSYDNGFTAVSNVFLDLPNIMTGLNDVLYGNDTNSTSQWNIDYYTDAVSPYDTKAIQYKNDASSKYQTARDNYDKSFADYKATSRSADNATIESLIDETYNTVSSVSEAIKSSNNLIQFYKDEMTLAGKTPKSIADTHLTTLNSYTSKVNSDLSSALSAQTSIENTKNSIVNDQRSIDEKTQSLAKLQAGPDPLDIRSQQLSITQKENALQDAKDQLAYYTVYAPFSGVITNVNFKKGDSVSSGTVLATLLTKQQFAEISLNEVDVSRIKVGQKATITFDAVPDLTIAGTVSEIDSIGTVTQGVVNYGVKVSFDTQDDRVKPGMSMSVAVLTDVKQDALYVPNSAVKTQGSNSYVQIIDAGATMPRQQAVEVGISNDSETEIISGLKEGDKVVTQTINSTAQATTSSSSASSGLRIPGITTGGGAGSTRTFRGN